MGVSQAFGRIFGITYGLSALVFPMMLAMSTGPDSIGGAFVILLMGAIVAAIFYLPKAGIIAGLIFFPFRFALSLIAGVGVSFFVSVSIAALLSASLTVGTKISFDPLGVSFLRNFWDLPISLGLIAAAVASVLAIVTVANGAHHE